MDAWMMRELWAERTPWLNDLAKMLDHLATNGRVQTVVLVAMALWVLRTRRWKPVVTLLGAAACSEGAAVLLKAIFDRPRPDPSRWLMVAHGSSMPSTVAATVAGTCAAAFLVSRGLPARTRRAIATAATLLTLVAGLAVIYVGVHWPTDVLAGWLLGVVVAIVVDLAVRRTGGRRSTSVLGSDAVVHAEEAGATDRLHASR